MSQDFSVPQNPCALQNPCLSEKQTARPWSIPARLLLVTTILIACQLSSLGPVLAEDAPTGSLTTWQNSPGITEILSMNRTGHLLGRREVQRRSLLEMEFFLHADGRDRSIPIPTDFTNIDLHRIGESGHLVGSALRTPGPHHGNQRALRWKLGDDQPELLPIPDSFSASAAFDVDASGSQVSGYVVGANPPRLQPCVWSKLQDEWTCELLPVILDYNPLLVTAKVAISDDGQTVAASIVTQVRADETRDYGLFIWRREPAGRWTREEKRVDRAVHLGDVNNHGTVAGRVMEDGKRRAFVSDPRLGPNILPLLPGRVSSYATGINQQGLVIGVLEDAPGPEGTTFGFVWDGTQTRVLNLPDRVVLSTANTITDDGRVAGMLIRAADGSPNEVEELPMESYVLRLSP